MGMEPIPSNGIEPCRSPQHLPPMHIYIPAGQQYRHKCPACGNEIVVRPPQVTL